MRLLTVRLRLSRHRAARVVLCLCILVTAVFLLKLPQPPSRRIVGYRILHAQKNLDRELLQAVLEKDTSSAKLALDCGANPNTAVTIPHIVVGCFYSVPGSFVKLIVAPGYTEKPGQYSGLHIALNKICFSLQTATPLNVAVFDDDNEMITLLLNNGAKSDFPADSPVSPLMMAAVDACDKPEKMPFLRRLLQHGDTFYTGPCTLLRLPLLHHAAESTNGATVLKMLLERGFDPNQRAVYNGWDGRTPLMMAEERNIPLLLSYRADISLKNDTGETALSEAKRKGYTSASLRLLVQHKQQH